MAKSGNHKKWSTVRVFSDSGHYEIEMRYVNSEGFLAEVFHPWVRWEGPGSGFENSSAGGAGPSGWAQAGPTWVGPSWAQVGGPTPGPRGWAQAGPKWVGPGYTDLAPLGLRSKNKVFELSG